MSGFPTRTIPTLTKEQSSRLLARAEEDVFGCWVWKGSKDPYYGIIRINGVVLKAHRVSYELFIGPIPTGMTLDHLCRNRACINPAHLEPVTLRENISRRQRPLKSHCPQGHPYDEANTYTYKGSRHCRLCQVIRQRTKAGSPIEGGRRPITHCPKGHEYTPENLRFDSRGARTCRECSRLACRAWREKRKVS